MSDGKPSRFALESPPAARTAAMVAAAATRPQWLEALALQSVSPGLRQAFQGAPGRSPAQPRQRVAVGAGSFAQLDPAARITAPAHIRMVHFGTEAARMEMRALDEVAAMANRRGDDALFLESAVARHGDCACVQAEIASSISSWRSEAA